MFRTSFRRFGSRKGRHAFTLVELLVVVAIIALLVSILLPTLNKAKEQARAVVCMTNLKNIALATQMYSHSYNNWIHATWGGYSIRGGDNMTWCDAMRAEEFLPELGESNTLSYCPDPLTPKAGSNWDTYSYGQRSPGIGYAQTPTSETYGSGYFNLAGSQVRCRRGWGYEFFYPYVPAEFVLSADTATGPPAPTQIYLFSDNESSTGGGSWCIEMRHAGKANCAFADSHVEGLGRTELNNLGFRDSNRLWPLAP